MEEQGFETICPLCRKKVIKVADSDRVPKGEVICENEYGIHVDSKYIKFKTVRHNYYDGKGQ